MPLLLLHEGLSVTVAGFLQPHPDCGPRMPPPKWKQHDEVEEVVSEARNDFAPNSTLLCCVTPGKLFACLNHICTTERILTPIKMERHSDYQMLMCRKAQQMGTTELTWGHWCCGSRPCSGTMRPGEGPLGFLSPYLLSSLLPVFLGQLVGEKRKKNNPRLFPGSVERESQRVYNSISGAFSSDDCSQGISSVRHALGL